MKRQSLIEINFKSFIIAIVSLLVIIISFWFYFDFFFFQKFTTDKIKSNILNEKKNNLRTVVNSIINNIDFHYVNIEKTLTSQIEKEIDNAYNIASNIYEKYKNNLPREEIEKLIIEALRPIRYNNSLGYFFAFDSKGNEKLFADKPELEGKNLINFKDAKGNYVIKDMIRLALTNGLGFYSYYWTRPSKNNSNFVYKKKAVIRYFKPLDLIIGTGLYYDDIKEKIANGIKEYISQFRYGKNNDNYVFIIKILKSGDNVSTELFVNPNDTNSRYRNTKHIDLKDADGKMFIREMVEKCLNNGEGFVTYKFKKLNSEEKLKKLSYVKLYPKWNWLVGTGVYVDKIDSIIAEQQHDTFLMDLKQMIIIVIIFITGSFIALFIFRKYNKQTKSEIQTLFASLHDTNIDPSKFKIKEFALIANNLKKFNNKIEEQNEILKAYFYKPKIGHFAINDRGYFEFVNKSFEKLLGYTEEEAKNLLFYEIVHPKQAQQVKNRGFKRLKGEKVIDDYDAIIMSKNGEEKWIKFINNRVFLKSENRYIILGSAIDITAEKKLMDEIKNQSNTFKAVINSLNIPVWVFDVVNNTYKIVNNAYREYFEVEEDVVNKPIKEVVKSEYYKKTIETNYEVVSKMQQVSYELNIENGMDTVTLLVNKNPIFNNEGKIIGIVSVGMDITDKLTVERLKSIESLGILAGGIAHDFNNILSAMLGNINLLEYYSKEEKSVKIIKSLEKNIKRAQKLSKKILTFAKGNFIAKESANIKNIVKEIVEFVLVGTSINVHYSIADKLPLVMIDKEQFSEVIHNIVLNARQAMEKNNGNTLYVTITTQYLGNEIINKLPEGEYVKIIIEDTGPGINPEIISNIFSPYFTTKESGSGFGLATSYSVIKQHGGTITVDSTEGKGAKFNIYIPVSHEIENTDDDEVTKPKIESVNTTILNILILEDEEYIREVLYNIFDLLGHNVHIVATGEEVINIFNNDFDLVITDITIKGGMGGIETLKRLRETHPNVYVIASTGYTDINVVEEFENHGFNDILIKPYKIETLTEVLETFIKHKKRTAN